MELKLLKVDLQAVGHEAFNRTIMELKHAILIWLATSTKLLIEP